MKYEVDNWQDAIKVLTDEVNRLAAQSSAAEAVTTALISILTLQDQMDSALLDQVIERVAQSIERSEETQHGQLVAEYVRRYRNGDSVPAEVVQLFGNASENGEN